MLHRLIAELFSPFFLDAGTKHIWINHYDGDKTNFAPSNLEWTTPSGNITHAFENGLRTDNDVVEVKDLRDESVMEFYSISESARYFRMEPSAMLPYLDRDKPKLFKNFYLIRRKGEEWPEYDPSQIGVFPKGTPKPLIVHDLTNNTYCIYITVTAAARDLGFNPYSIVQVLRVKKSREYKGFKFTYVENAFELLEASKQYEVKGEILPRKRAELN